MENPHKPHGHPSFGWHPLNDGNDQSSQPNRRPERMQGPKLPTPCPIDEHVRAPTLNANGLLTKIRVGNRKVTRLSNVAAYARANNLDLLAIQEPHVLSDTHYNSITDEFRKHGYSFQSQTHPSGYGGVGIAWKSTDWTLRSSLGARWPLWTAHCKRSPCQCPDPLHCPPTL